MVFGCTKVNLKIYFGSNLRPNTEHAFRQFWGLMCSRSWTQTLPIFKIHSLPGGGGRPPFTHSLGCDNLTSSRWGSAWVVKGSVG
jgi:hypothetical protein